MHTKTHTWVFARNVQYAVSCDIPHAQHMTSTSQLMQDCTHYMWWTGMMVVKVSQKSTTLTPSRSTHREANRWLLIQQLLTVEESLYGEAADCWTLALQGPVVLSPECREMYPFPTGRVREHYTCWTRMMVVWISEKSTTSIYRGTSYTWQIAVVCV